MIHAPRKCPIALHPKVKEHLNKMECLGMITQVDEPTDWVSSITYVQKANGKLCLCWIPATSMRPSAVITTRCPLWRKLLMSLHTLTSSPGWMPTMNTGQSSLTMTPACFDFQQSLWKMSFPFGLVCSQDIFQKKMDQILEECQGCIRMANDITVHGHTEAEHDACL